MQLYNILVRLLLLASFLIGLNGIGWTQAQSITQLRNNYLNAKDDSTRQNACLDLYVYYNEVNRDSALFYIDQRLSIAKKVGYKLLEAAVLNAKSYQKTQTGKYAESLKCIMQSLKIAEDSSNREINRWRITQFPATGNERLSIISAAMHQIGLLMRETENLDNEIIYFKKALVLAQKINHIDRQMVSSMNVGSAYLRKGMLDSALYYGLQSDSMASLPGYQSFFRGRNLANMGDVYFKKGNYEQAKQLYRQGLDISIKLNNQFNVAVTKHKLVQLFLRLNESDSALYYAKENLRLIQLLSNGANFQLNLGNAYEDIYLVYKQRGINDSAYKYLNLTFQLKEGLYKERIANLSAFQNVSFDEALRLENLDKVRIQSEARFRLYSLLAGLVVVSIVGIVLYRNNVRKRKTNLLLERQKNEIEAQKNHVEQAMDQLKSTQAQLVQSEKMASLGELTAGIAHEIQNPLNFVNNFSEVSNELIDEMKAELDKGEVEEAKTIAADIQQNLSKIAHHGKRADSIVKGMLQHSRSSTGQKELTDINALCDEYLRLSYHGLRAKDKQFQAQYETVFDPALQAVPVMAQEIGRVVLNLINNAFYAVHERQKQLLAVGKNESYMPKVLITTRLVDEMVSIEVKDNGNGIPAAIREKIFQPFFTTKPVGEGTGLGLSLSYDIITKGHGGKLTVESEEGLGTSFRILLPIR